MTVFSSKPSLFTSFWIRRNADSEVSPRQESHVHDGLGLFRKHVRRLAAAGDRGHHGRSDQGVQRRLGGELPGDESTGQPAIRQHNTMGPGHLRSEKIEHRGRRPVDPRREWVRLQPSHHGRDHPDGRVRRWHRRVPSLGPCRQPDRGISLLGDSDERNRSVDSVDDPLGQSATLVEDEPEPDTPTAQDLGNSSVPLAAADLLIVPEREVHVAGRAEAVVQETFGRFEQPERAAFHVECTTTPDETLREISRERGVRPIRFRPGLDRDDVDVRHQQDRFTRWVGAFPSVEEAVATVDLAVEASVNPGE